MRGLYVLYGLNLLLLFSLHGEANNNGKVHIVYMGATNFPNGTARSDDLARIKSMLRNEDSVVQSYSQGLLGFAARLSKEEAESIAQRPEVVSVFPDRVLQLHTTRSWDFLESQSAFNNIESTPTKVSNCSTQVDTIIGILDSGIWPESPSFNDKYMGPIPSRWKGICMSSENFTCNRKVIGARYYDDPDEPGAIPSARDGDGHGTHIASTAAGMPIWGASYYGLARGLAKGGSPGSRIAIYRICPTNKDCLGSAVLKAFDDAIGDGVDVLSLSMGISPQDEDIVTDPISIGAFHAVEKGIIVVGSAGNKGPSPLTVCNVAPWILTVGGTTIDRDFEADIMLGSNKVIKGGGLNFSGLNKSAAYPLVDGRSASNQDDVTNASNCMPGSLRDDKIKGKIILCESKDMKYGPVSKFRMLKKQGAIGMILVDNIHKQVPYKYGTNPIAAVSEEDGARIQSYIISTSNALATILPTRSVIATNKPAPIVIFFSSRGPIYGIANLIKPDVVAPGLGILAAWPLNDTSVALPGKEPPIFNILSGTSMSCPHVSGLAAVIKYWHPTWNPSAIRSAIMTTAIQTNNLHVPITTHTGSRATPYDIGAGEINLHGSLSPGLVYETKTTDYIQFLCNMGYNASVIKTMSSTVPSKFCCPDNSSSDLISDLNYPSIAVSGLKANGSRTVERIVTNVGGEYSTYTAKVEAPTGMQVQVVPNTLHFAKDAKKLSFRVTFTLTTTTQDNIFGSITWVNVNHKVRSPFVIVSNA